MYSACLRCSPDHYLSSHTRLVHADGSQSGIVINRRERCWKYLLQKGSPGLVVAGSVLPCIVGVHSFAGDHTECCFASQVFCDNATGDTWQSGKDEDREAALQS